MRRVVAILAALVVATPVAAAAQLAPCATDAHDCCCESEEDLPCLPSLRPSRCCDVASRAPSPARTAPDATQIASEMTPAAPPRLAPPLPEPRPRVAVRLVAPEPSSRGSPVFLQHCSLLI